MENNNSNFNNPIIIVCFNNVRVNKIAYRLAKARRVGDSDKQTGTGNSTPADIGG